MIDGLEQLNKGRVLVVGDMILDEFVWGRVNRISPEAPVPVVEVERREWYLGGAANVARNMAPFAARAGMVGRMGMDSFAEKSLELFEVQGIGVPVLLQDEALPTIVKTRIFAGHQQVVRVDVEKVCGLRQTHREAVVDYLSSHQQDWDVVILQDYAKGFFDQGLLDRLMGICGNDVLLVADPNPRNQLEWRGCHTVKPNRLEAFAASAIQDPGHHPALPAEDEVFLRVGATLLDRWRSRFVLMTLGELGMLLFDRQQPEKPKHLLARASEVFDVSGAGDTAIGFYALALASGASAADAAWLANAASSRVVEKVGTAQLLEHELKKILEDYR